MKKIILYDDFINNSLNKINNRLFSFNDLNQNEKEAFQLFLKTVLNDKKLKGRNKNSWSKITNEGIEEEIETTTAQQLKEKKLYHYHLGDVSSIENNMKYSLPSYFQSDQSKLEEKIILEANKNGYVCNTLVHYKIIENKLIMIYAITRHRPFHSVSSL